MVDIVRSTPAMIIEAGQDQPVLLAATMLLTISLVIQIVRFCKGSR